MESKRSKKMDLPLMLQDLLKEFPTLFTNIILLKTEKRDTILFKYHVEEQNGQSQYFGNFQDANVDNDDVFSIINKKTHVTYILFHVIHISISTITTVIISIITIIVKIVVCNRI